MRFAFGLARSYAARRLVTSTTPSILHLEENQSKMILFRGLKTSTKISWGVKGSIALMERSSTDTRHLSTSVLEDNQLPPEPYKDPQNSELERKRAQTALDLLEFGLRKAYYGIDFTVEYRGVYGQEICQRLKMCKTLVSLFEQLEVELNSLIPKPAIINKSAVWYRTEFFNGLKRVTLSLKGSGPVATKLVINTIRGLYCQPLFMTCQRRIFFHYEVINRIQIFYLSATSVKENSYSPERARSLRRIFNRLCESSCPNRWSVVDSHDFNQLSEFLRDRFEAQFEFLKDTSKTVNNFNISWGLRNLTQHYQESKIETYSSIDDYHHEISSLMNPAVMDIFVVATNSSLTGTKGPELFDLAERLPVL